MVWLNEIGDISDIKKAFLQICLLDPTRDFVRFLWLNKSGHIKINRHSRVVFGVSCSPFLLGAVMNHHLNTIKQKCTYQTDLIWLFKFFKQFADLIFEFEIDWLKFITPYTSFKFGAISTV